MNTQMGSTGQKSVTPVACIQSACFACGAEHPHGLGLQFVREPGGHVVADWTPSRDWEGFRGIIHGGIVSTVLDEAMSKAVASTGPPSLTCQLEVRFRHSVLPGEALTVRGWVVERHKRRVLVEAEIRDQAGTEKAHGRATFLTSAAIHQGPDFGAAI